LGFFQLALELAAVGVGEGGGAGKTQLDAVPIEEVIVGAVFGSVEVNVCECPAVGVLRVADTGYL
jgi:hypothetical protein